MNVHWDGMTRQDFTDLVMQPSVATVANNMGADPGAMIEAAVVLCEEAERDEKQLGFEDLVELVLNMRGKNAAKVRDIKEQVNLLKRAFTESTASVMNEMTESFSQLRSELRSVHEAAL